MCIVLCNIILRCLILVWYHFSQTNMLNPESPRLVLRLPLPTGNKLG